MFAPIMAATISQQWNEFWSRIGKVFAEAGWRLIILFSTLIIGVVIIRFVTQFLRRTLLKSRLNNTLCVFFLSIIKFVLYFALIFILAGIIGISMTPLITVLGAISLVIALAVQNTVSNVANGVLIIASRPFKVGDHIIANGIEGTVKSIKMTMTELMTPTNQKIIIPNTKIMSDNIVNFTARPTRRIDFEFTIAIPENFDTVREMVGNILISDPRVFDDPAPEVVISEFKDNSLTFITRCWVKTGDYQSVYNETIESVFNAFKENGIKIDYNKLEIDISAQNKEVK